MKSKDVPARSMAIELLGTIAARLKRDSVLRSRGKFWILQELVSGDRADQTYPKDVCSACLDGRVEKPFFVCQGCQRMFHADCMGVREHEVPNQTWHCQICLCRKQLLVLQSYCKSQCKDDGIKDHESSGSTTEVAFPITKLEVVQQLLLNYLQDTASADDVHLFVRWYVLMEPHSFLTVWFYCCGSEVMHVFPGFMCACGTRMIHRSHSRSSFIIFQD